MPRKGTVWTAGAGWVRSQEYEAAQYDGLGDGWGFLISFWRWFPDMLCDLSRSDEADYELTLLQRVFMRAKARYQYCDITACRGATKSFCSILEEGCEGLLWPGITTAYFGPSLRQTAKIGADTWETIQENYPALAAHYNVEVKGGDRFKITTGYGSSFSIDAFRGANLCKVVAEEYAQEEAPPFDIEDYKRVVLPAVRIEYRVKGKRDPTYVRFKQHSITSASRRQNHAYETRCRHIRMMARGESAFVMDVSYEVILLMQMRPVMWAETLKSELSPDEWAREMESLYTGSDKNPVVRDSVLTESRCMLLMEEHHCCKDHANKVKPEDVKYIIGYDVSYADGAINAKCACAVIKLTKQTNWLKRDRYLKQVVWLAGWEPEEPRAQAARLKTIWNRYCFEGSETYIAIDAWQYGTAVLQSLMGDLEDGLPPLCSHDHSFCPELERDGAIPVVFPVKAGGVGVTDPDSEMLRYAEVQFENRNVQLLTSNWGEGLDAYKTYHRIKDDELDHLIYAPYKETNVLIGQMQNLRKVPSGAGMAEKRISSHIQRDDWSALKYALRVAQRLETKYLLKTYQKSAWDAEYQKGSSFYASSGGVRTVGRFAGRKYT